MRPDQPSALTRRFFLHSGMLPAAASSLLRGGFVTVSLVETARAAPVDLVHDTLTGLRAFIVPGPDAYSVTQGKSTAEPGSVDAGVIEVLIRTLDLSAPFLPGISAIVAATLNNLAQLVNPTASTPFQSPFANLKYA